MNDELPKTDPEIIKSDEEIFVYALGSIFAGLFVAFVLGIVPTLTNNTVCGSFLPELLENLAVDIAIVVGIVVSLLIFPIARVFGWQGSRKSRSLVWTKSFIMLILALVLTVFSNPIVGATIPGCGPVSPLVATAHALNTATAEARHATAVERLLEYYGAQTSTEERVDIVGTMAAKSLAQRTPVSTPSVTPTYSGN